MPLTAQDKSKLTLLGLGAGVSAYSLMSDIPRNRRIGIFLLGATGALGVYYLIKKYPKGELPDEEKPVEKPEEYVIINIPPIFIPASVGETKVKEVARSLRPKVKPSVRPLGVIFYWEPIKVSFPFGDVRYQPPSKFASIKDIQKARRIARELGPTVERVPGGWHIKFKTIKVEV